MNFNQSKLKITEAQLQAAQQKILAHLWYGVLNKLTVFFKSGFFLKLQGSWTKQSGWQAPAPFF
jgi:hypothetical protein